MVHLLSRESVRLLTLTRPLGVGKTRLALEAAGALRDEQGFELAFADLVAVGRADRVLPAIAQALGVRFAGDRTLLDALIAAMGTRRILLVLDNFEHVLDAAPTCAALLGACPRSKALATSRSPLNIRGEHEFEVPPLPVPHPDALPPMAELEHVGSIALFVERARALKPDFALDTEEQARLVATICARLDGLPLAIELAAAQVKHFSLSELAARLEGAAPLDLLVGGPRDLADHQRAMRSTTAWSYDLLSPDERRVFRVLGAFPGGATPVGLAEVTELPPEIIAKCLAALLDANLVRRVHEQDQPRFYLLVIMRAFAIERLRESGELEATRVRFAAYIATLVDHVHPSGVDTHTASLNLVLREHDNVLSVLQWTLDSGDLLMGLRMCAGLRYLWERRGYPAEGADGVKRLLNRAGEPQTVEEQKVHAAAWEVLLVLNHRLGRFERAAEAGTRALELCRAIGDSRRIGVALNGLANPLANLGDLDGAEQLYLQSLAIHREVGNRLAEATTLLNLGDLRTLQGRYDEALAFEEDSLAISRSVGAEDPGRALLLSNMGETLIMMDRPREASDVLEVSCRLFEELNEPFVLPRFNLARAAWRSGDFNKACAFIEQAIQVSRRQGDDAMLVQEFCVVAGIALDRLDVSAARQALDMAFTKLSGVSDPRVHLRVVERSAGYVCCHQAFADTARLYAAAECGRASRYDLVDPAERDLRARDLAAARQSLGMRAFDEAIRTGQVLSPVEALAAARDSFAAVCSAG